MDEGEREEDVRQSSGNVTWLKTERRVWSEGTLRLLRPTYWINTKKSVNQSHIWLMSFWSRGSPSKVVTQPRFLQLQSIKPRRRTGIVQCIAQ